MSLPTALLTAMVVSTDAVSIISYDYYRDTSRAKYMFSYPVRHYYQARPCNRPHPPPKADQAIHRLVLANCKSSSISAARNYDHMWQSRTHSDRRYSAYTFISDTSIPRARVPYDTMLAIVILLKHSFASQVYPPPSISHSLHASDESFTSNNLHHLILVHLVKHTRAEDFPHLRRSVADVTVRLLRK